MSKLKCTKHTRFGTLLEVAMSKKCTPLWREAHFEVKMRKAPHVRATFGGSDVLSRGRRKGLWTLSKVSKAWGFCGISRNDGRRGAFEEDLQRCIFRGRCSTRDMFIRAVRRSGADFLRGVAFWSVRSSGLLRWFCVTGAALCVTWHHFFVAGAILSTGGLDKSQNALVRGCQLRTQLSIFEGCLAEFICFWCCRLAELLRFGCCPVQKMKKSCRIASFLMLSTSKNWKSRRLASFLMLSTLKMRKSRRIAAFLMLSTLKKWRSLAG